MNKIVLAVVAVIIIAVGVLLLSNKSNTQPTQTTQSVATPTQAVSQTASPSGVMMEKQKTITLTANGFDPQVLTIKAGTTITWVNKSGQPGTVNSDPHPTHTLWPFLNIGMIADGSSGSATFDKAGTYTYHNHLNVAQTGTVIVQ